MKFGIISMSENDTDILMWAYYSQNNGFVIKFDLGLLPKSFFGPFPINYTEDLEKLKYTEENAPLCVHYQTNIKEERWDHEKEWRFLTYNPEGKYIPHKIPKDLISRKFNYNKEAVMEVILGYNFFSLTEIRREPEFDIVRLKANKTGKNEKKLKRKILKHILENDIPCSRIVRKTDEYKLVKNEITFEQLGRDKFKIFQQESH